MAHAHGVATEYEDWQHKTVTVSRATVLAVLAALDVDAPDATETSPEAGDSSATQRVDPAGMAQTNRVLPPCVVTIQGREATVELQVSARATVVASLELEDGSQAPVVVEPGSLLVPDDLPLGYHVLRARADGAQAACTVIVTPVDLDLPASVATRRAWGLATQLYSVRSRQSWAIGDLEDLKQLAVWSAGELGADYVLVNPLSAAEPVAPMEPSPYLPSSRRFVNPLYLRIESLPEYDDLPPTQRADIERLRADVHERLDGVDTIDRDTSWAAKAAALRLLHARPRSSERERSHREFVRREGAALRDFATWCAIVNRHGTDPRQWPPGLRYPDHPEVAAFRSAQHELVDFYSWLQWLLDEQLAAVQAAALDAGMALGVMHDLAVGVHPEGADAWAMQDVLAHGIHVGAPPDAFNQVGQDWSQPPWRPDRLVELSYAPFRDLVAQQLRHAGAVRIDHILGLFRLWWIPAGMSADQGTYVGYDHEALVGVLALEASRAGALVVGEDLGTVEPFVRDYLRTRGIVGTAILWFEAGDDGGPLPPELWREHCLASVTTHDLPPTEGYLAGEHVRLRSELGLLSRPVEQERAADAAKQAAWRRALADRALLPRDATPEQTVVALHRYLTLTPARLLCVALTDAVGDRRTQNQPGTTNEYPNWRVPLTGPDGSGLLLEDVMASARACDLASAVNAGLEHREATRRPARNLDAGPGSTAPPFDD
ncbi:MAG: 4-alpha-glucanotransferase [Nocardioidaceae bacterium]